MVGSFADNFHPMDAANLGDLLRAAEPSKAAIIDCREWQNPTTLSYGALEQSASAIARGLLARGLKRGERVAIVSRTAASSSPPISASFVPVSSPCRWTQIAARDARARARGRAAPRCTTPTEARFCLPESRAYLRGMAGRFRIRDLSHRSFRAARAGDDSLYLGLERPAERRGAHARGAPLGGEDAPARRSARSSSAADRGAAFPYERARTPGPALAAGATVVLLPQFDTRRYIEAIERFGCTWLTAVPPMLAMMFREGAPSMRPTCRALPRSAWARRR